MDDEYLLDTPRVRGFIAEVRAALEAQPVAEALAALQPAFVELLADQSWLPEEFMRPAEQGAMGGGIATWLIYRAGDGGLSLFSLVVPAGSATPVHDHLAWGLIGLHAGQQDERVYRRAEAYPSAAPHSHGDGPGEHHEGLAALELVEQNHLRPGDCYLLMPPDGDIHSVATTSDTPSVSIHLLGNDTGCVWRHAYQPEEGTVRPFKSGWSNRECEREG
jgi:predicted metal-dependent enzyme (double-stranded beta helix superfamily)